MNPLDHLPHEHALTLSGIEHDLKRAEHSRAAALLHNRVSGAWRNPGVVKNKLETANLLAPSLTLTDYLEGQAQPPAHIWRGLWPGFKNVLGNADWGDCGEAMVAHGVEAMQAAAANLVTPFTPTDAISFYSIVGNFVQGAGPPGQNPTDNGTDNKVLMNKMQTMGLKCFSDGSVHKFTVAIDVPVGDEVAQKIAIAEFVVLFRAINLPMNAQGKSTWWLRGNGQTGDSAPGSWGGHDVPYVGYAVNGDYDCDSWGLLMPSGHRFDKVYGLQGLVCLSPDMMSRSGVSPTGLNYTKLMADIAKLGTPA